MGMYEDGEESEDAVVDENEGADKKLGKYYVDKVQDNVDVEREWIAADKDIFEQEFRKERGGEKLAKKRAESQEKLGEKVMKKMENKKRGNYVWQPKDVSNEVAYEGRHVLM